MKYDYKNHDELIEELKLKDDNESKLAVKSYKDMNILYMLGVAIFIVFAISYFIMQKLGIEIKDIFCIINTILIMIPMIMGVFSGRYYRKYINNNEIVILEDLLYFYSK